MSRACLLTVYGFETKLQGTNWNSVSFPDVVHASLPFTVLKQDVIVQVLGCLGRHLVVHASLPFTVLKLP